MPDSRDKLTIFLITGSSSFKQKDRIDDGRGSKAHDISTIHHLSFCSITLYLITTIPFVAVLRKSYDTSNKWQNLDESHLLIKPF